MPQGIEKARKHCEMLLQGGDLDSKKVCTAMYDSDWEGGIWNSPDESDEEVSKTSDSVPTQPPVKKGITIDDPIGDEPRSSLF